MNDQFSTYHSIRSPSLSGLLCKMMLVEAAADEPLDQGLSADVELSSRFIQFLKHVSVQINPDAVDRRHHLALVRKIGRYVLPLVRQASYRFCGHRSFGFRGSLHTAFVLPW